jgi:sugar phosphate isomerase/epimerase
MKVPLAARARGAGDMDIPSALPWLAGLGYRGIEVGRGVFDGPSPGEFKRMADEAGLAVTTYMGSREQLRGEFDALVADCHTLECGYVVQAWGPAENPVQMKRAAREYGEFGARCAGAGLQFCYHNHDHEFTARFDGTRAIDLLIETTRPEHLKLQLDLGWAACGGADPAEFLRAHRERCPVTHLRDVADLKERGKWAPIGQGVLDIQGIVRAAVQNGTEWVILEQKAIGGLSREEGIERTARYFRDLGLL